MTASLAPYPLLIPPALAKEIGLHEAVILQQIHYWLERSNHLINGCLWIYNTYQAWQEQFPFLSLSAIRRAIARLEGLNLLKTERFEQRRWNQTKWYSINYKRLEVLLSSICSNQGFQSAQIEQLNPSTLRSSFPEITAFIISENTSPLTPQNEEIKREEEKSSGNTVIAQSCTSLVKPDELSGSEQPDFDEGHFSAPASRIQNNFDGSSHSDTPEIEPNLVASIPNAVNKLVKHQNGSNGGDHVAAPSNLPLFESPARTQLLTRLSVLTTEPKDSLRVNTSLASALDRYPDRANDALEYFQQALATWKNKPGIGLFIHAVKTGQKLSLTKPGCGWKEWADEAIKRRLMQYSHSQDGDIMVHFVGGDQALWSRLRSLPWSEVEVIANGGQTV